MQQRSTAAQWMPATVADAATASVAAGDDRVGVVEALAVRTTALLDGAGVRWRLTKGAAIAHLDHPQQVAERTFGDVDFVVHPGDWPASLKALHAGGLQRPGPELRPRFDVRFGKGATFIDAAALEVDLHRRFAVGRFGVLA